MCGTADATALALEDSLKVPKLLFRFPLRAANSLATSIRQSLSVLCLRVLSTVKLLNLVSS